MTGEGATVPTASNPASPRRVRSLTRATLYRVALGVTLIVAVSSGVTYHLLYREIEQRALERLREYAVQRAEYHESRFSLARAFHEVVRTDLLRRYREPMPDAERRFDALMSRDPDGAWRNSPAFSDVRRYSTGWGATAQPSRTCGGIRPGGFTSECNPTRSSSVAGCCSLTFPSTTRGSSLRGSPIST
jgi:hypothetical protein